DVRRQHASSRDRGRQHAGGPGGERFDHAAVWVYHSGYAGGGGADQIPARFDGPEHCHGEVLSARHPVSGVEPAGGRDVHEQRGSGRHGAGDKLRKQYLVADRQPERNDAPQRSLFPPGAEVARTVGSYLVARERRALRDEHQTLLVVVATLMTIAADEHDTVVRPAAVVARRAEDEIGAMARGQTIERPPRKRPPREGPGHCVLRPHDEPAFSRYPQWLGPAGVPRH